MKTSLRLIVGLFVLVLLGSRTVVRAATATLAANGCLNCGSCEICN